MIFCEVPFRRVLWQYQDWKRVVSAQSVRDVGSSARAFREMSAALDAGVR